MSEILVIGDTCKDIYVYGSCDRLCPDYPVPSFIPSHEKQSLGMAGNVYQNILSLGARATLKTNSTVIEKTRYVDKKTNHMFLRVDSGEEKVQRVKGLTKDFLSKFKLIIINNPSINDKIIQTLAGKGCKMADKHFHVEKVEIKDSCGAGDTFLAALCFKYLDCLKITHSIVFANKCATQVVQQRGVNVIKK